MFCWARFRTKRTSSTGQRQFEFGPGVKIRTCSAEDLVVLKLFASRPLDIRDAEGVIERNAARLDWAYVEDQLRPLAEGGSRNSLDAGSFAQILRADLYPRLYCAARPHSSSAIWNSRSQAQPP